MYISGNIFNGFAGSNPDADILAVSQRGMVINVIRIGNKQLAVLVLASATLNVTNGDTIMT